MDKQRLQRQKKDLENQWDLFSEKLSRLERAKILETKPEEQFRLEQEIIDIQIDRQKIEEQLNDIEAKLHKDVSPISKIIIKVKESLIIKSTHFRFRTAITLIVVVIFLGGWGLAHWTTKPGETVSVWFGLIEYTLAPIVGQERYDSISGIDFIWMPKGCFQMGCVSGIDCKDTEKPVHEVCLDGFWIGKHEVTQAQWQQVMGVNPSYFSEDKVGQSTSKYPIEGISWNDAQKFLQKLNERAGKKMYRLPSETEWEYACRAKTKTAYSFGNDVGRLRQYACYKENSGHETQPVCQFLPNAFGLYDMHGNVWEWCADPWHENYKDAPCDGSVWESDGQNSWRVVRSGAWHNSSEFLRCAKRDRFWKDLRVHFRGFRVVMMVITP